MAERSNLRWPSLPYNHTVLKMIRFCTLFVFGILLNLSAASSQISLYPMQGFNFGTFYQGNSGGTISISTNGARTATGDIVLMNSWLPNAQAVFEIEAAAGTRISISNGNDGTLHGSKGGTLTLHLETTEPGPVFTTTAVLPARTTLNLSAKLIVGNRTVSPPGIYEGTFFIIFNQE